MGTKMTNAQLAKQLEDEIEERKTWQKMALRDEKELVALRLRLREAEIASAAMAFRSEELESMVRSLLSGKVDPVNMEAMRQRVKGLAKVPAEETVSKVLDAMRMDELTAVMYSVDKWFDGPDDPRLKQNPATRAADAREIALRAIESVAMTRGETHSSAEKLKKMLDLVDSLQQESKLLSTLLLDLTAHPLKVVLSRTHIRAAANVVTRRVDKWFRLRE